MIKKVLTFVLALLFLPGVLAITTDLKQSYQPGETIITKISGNILEPIQPSQVQFLRLEHVQVPFNYDIKKLGNDYYLWAVGPLNVTQQNYTLLLKDVVTTVLGQRQTIDFRQNFSVEGNFTAYTIKPGFIVTRKDFAIQATLYEDEPHVISLDFPTIGEITLQPGENTIPFSIRGVAGTQLIPIHLGRYAIPALISGNASGNTKPLYLAIQPEYIEDLQARYTDNFVYLVTLTNFGSQKIDDVAFDYDKNIFTLMPAKTKTLDVNASISFNLTMNVSKYAIEKRSLLSEEIYVQSQEANFSFVLPVDISFQVSQSNSTENQTNGTLYSCFELGGKVCPSEDYCDGKVQNSLEGDCCMGACTPASNGKSSNLSWIGWLIAAVVVIIVIFTFVRYKRTKAETNPMAKQIEAAEKKVGMP